MTWRRAGRAVWSGTGVAAAILSFAGPASAQFMDK